jgi:hypothetical protein
VLDGDDGLGRRQRALAALVEEQRALGDALTARAHEAARIVSEILASLRDIGLGAEYAGTVREVAAGAGRPVSRARLG